MFKFKWLSENDSNAGGGASGTPTQQGNSGNEGQGLLDKRIKELSDENANWRNKHKTAEQERDSWKQKFEEATGKLNTEAQKAALERALITAAARQGFSDPEDALKFIDLSKLDAAEDKRTQVITDALKVLTEAKPYLIRSAPAAPPPPTTPPPKQPSAANPAGGLNFTPEDIAKMTPDQINQNWEAVQKALSGKA